jgi:predicted nuclease of predicted toxin-antitoxin system
VKIKLDENLPDDLALLLRAAEYDVATVEEEGLAGHDDPPVLQAATKEDRVLMSFDLGFLA